jgi:hypothetical protein
MLKVYAAEIPYLTAINQNIVNPFLRFLFVLALVVFLWGIFQYIREGDNEAARGVGRQHMLWGIVGLFIMMGVYGILNIICNTIDCN